MKPQDAEKEAEKLVSAWFSDILNPNIFILRKNTVGQKCIIDEVAKTLTRAYNQGLERAAEIAEDHLNEIMPGVGGVEFADAQNVVTKMIAEAIRKEINQKGD